MAYLVGAGATPFGKFAGCAPLDLMAYAAPGLRIGARVRRGFFELAGRHLPRFDVD